MATVDLQSSPVPVEDIDATGTPSASTFLRGDGTWETPAGGGGSGGLVFIDEPTLTEGVWTFELGDLTPDFLEIHIVGGSVSADGTGILLEIQVASNWVSADYGYALSQRSTGGTSNNVESASASNVILAPTSTWGIGTGSDKTFDYKMTVWAPAATGRKHGFWNGIQDASSANSARIDGGWRWTGGTGAIEALRVSGTSGAINGGRMLVFAASSS